MIATVYLPVSLFFFLKKVRSYSLGLSLSQLNWGTRKLAREQESQASDPCRRNCKSSQDDLGEASIRRRLDF